MSDIVDTGAAGAVSEGTAAPAQNNQEQVVDTPKPLSTEPQTVEKKDEPAEKPKLSARDAIKQAKEKIEAKEREEGDKAKPVDTKGKTDAQKPDAKADPKGADKPDPKAADKTADKADPAKGPQRDETGRFAAKEGAGAQEGADKTSSAGQNKSPLHEPPKRFDAEAQRDWLNAPESVRGAIHRALRENEEGITKYKQSHERYEQFREYDEVAKSNGRDLKESIGKIVEFERVMTQNPLAAVNYALREAGPRKPDGTPITVDDIVAHVHGQSDDQRLQRAQAEANELRAHIQKLENHIRQSQAVAKIPDVVKEFASDPAHSRFEELSETIAVLIEAGTAPDLKTAYKLADTLKPATNGAHTPDPANGAHTAKTTDDDAEAQTLKAQEAAAAKAAQSVKGAPGSGSTPATKPKSSTIKDSLRRAFAQAG